MDRVAVRRLVYACLLISFMLAPGAAADPLSVGPLAVDVGPSTGDPAREEYDNASGWDHDGVKGSISTSDGLVNLTYNVYCGTNLGPAPSNGYPWDGAWCWGLSSGTVAGEDVAGFAVCGAVVGEANTTASDEPICIAFARAGEEWFLAYGYCFDDRYPDREHEPGAGCFGWVTANVQGTALSAVTICYALANDAGNLSDDQALCYVAPSAAGLDPIPYAKYTASTACVGVHPSASEDATEVCSSGVALCFPHNPQALTNACIQPGNKTVTRPDADPSVTAPDPAVTPGAGICLIGNVCGPGVEIGDPQADPGLGTKEQPLPWLAGYAEATAACAVAPQNCRATVPG